MSGRVKHYINAFGEELMIDNADEAIKEACKATHAVINDYTAAPIYFSETGNGGHEWLIEFEKEPESLEAFTKNLDQNLKKLNSDYEAKRYKDIAMCMPVVHAIAKGSFLQWLQLKGKLGGQHKIPRLSNDRNYVEEILELQTKSGKKNQVF